MARNPASAPRRSAKQLQRSTVGKSRTFQGHVWTVEQFNGRFEVKAKPERAGPQVTFGPFTGKGEAEKFITRQSNLF